MPSAASATDLPISHLTHNLSSPPPWQFHPRHLQPLKIYSNQWSPTSRPSEQSPSTLQPPPSPPQPRFPVIPRHRQRLEHVLQQLAIHRLARTAGRLGADEPLRLHPAACAGKMEQIPPAARLHDHLWWAQDSDALSAEADSVAFCGQPRGEAAADYGGGLDGGVWGHVESGRERYHHRGAVAYGCLVESGRIGGREGRRGGGVARESVVVMQDWTNRGWFVRLHV